MRSICTFPLCAGTAVALLFTTVAQIPPPAPSTPSPATVAKLNALVARIKQNDAQAMFEVALMRQRGVEIPLDLDAAFRWLIKSANAGNTRAMNQLAFMYEMGRYGIAASPEKRAYWVQKSAAAGDAWGLYALADMQFAGNSMPMDKEAAKKLVIHAAEVAQVQASDGIVDAMETLSEIYADGVTPLGFHPEKAMEWAQKSFDAGNLRAAESYANAALLSRDPHNAEKAFHMYRQAARAGEALGLNGVGKCFSNGFGVLKDLEESKRWFQAAADRGLSGAKCNLGSLYWGTGRVPLDRANAVKYFEAALAQRNSLAMVLYGKCLFEEGPDTRERGLQLLQRAVECYRPDAALYLAIQYEQGTLPRDPARAFEYRCKAADFGSALARYEVARCYSLGIGVPRDPQKGLELYKECAAKGDPNAMVSLASMYSGEGIPPDYNQERAWAEKAAARNLPRGHWFLGNMYYRGQGVPVDDKKALSEFTIAADAQDPLAMKSLAEMYTKGRGVTADLARARDWMQRAADAGDLEAREWILAHPAP